MDPADFRTCKLYQLRLRWRDSQKHSPQQTGIYLESVTIFIFNYNISASAIYATDPQQADKILNIYFSKRHSYSPRYQPTLFIQLIYTFFTLPSSYQQHFCIQTHNSYSHSEEDLTLETSALATLYGGNLQYQLIR